MSGLAKFEVEVGADISGLQTGLNKAAGVTQAYASKVNQSFKDVAKSSNTAGQSLTNLGRIAQDAPFGFIGIQNNINPLIESFQRLKVETGSTVGAFKALGSSLLGGAGIGLAVSVATGLLSVLAQKGFFSSKVAADEAAKANKEFAQSLKDVETQGIATGLKLQNYVNIARDSTKSLDDRNAALREANKIMGEHGDKLTLVNIATAAATEQINKFTQATIQQALASKFADRAADLIIQQREAIKSYTIARTAQTTAEQRYQNIAQKGITSNAAAGAATFLETAGQRTAKAAAAYKSVTKDLQDVIKQLADSQTLASDLFGDIGFKEAEKKAKKAVDKIKKIFKVSFKEEPIEFIDPDQFGRDVEAAFAKIKNINAATIQIPVDIAPSANTDNLAGLKEAQMIAYLEGQGITKAMQDGINIGVRGLRFPELRDLYESTKKSVGDFNDKIGQLSIDMQQNIAIAFGEGLGNALATLDLKGGLGAMFSGIFNILGGGLKELGKYLIGTSKLIQAFKTAFKAFSPAGQLIAGIGLVALGALIQSKASQIPGFADGVNNFRGGLAMVGERGPELVNLPAGSNVIPNHDLNGLGGSSVVIPDVRIDGRDLVLIFNRAQKTLSLTG